VNPVKTKMVSSVRSAAWVLLAAGSVVTGIFILTIKTAYWSPASNTNLLQTALKLFQSDLTRHPTLIWTSVISPIVFVIFLSMCFCYLIFAANNAKTVQLALVLPSVIFFVLVGSNIVLSGGFGLVILAFPFLVYPLVIGLRLNRN